MVCKLFFMIVSFNLFASKKIELGVGESTFVEVKDHYSLKLSRRGIVDISYEQSGRWKVTGLKPGFVLLKIFNYEDKLDSQFNLWVKDMRRKKNDFPSWVCEQKEVECSDYNQTILGKISDPILFYKAKSWCQNKSNCYFKAFLDDTSKNFIKKNLVFTLVSSSKKNVLRGLHMQTKKPQDKFLSVLKGKVLDVVVDLRKNSKTYGKHFKIILSDFASFI